MNSLASALTNIRRSPYQSLTAILMVSITFFVAHMFALFVIGTEQILQYFETRPQIIAFFDLDAPQESIELAETTMQEKPYVEDIEIVSKEEALKIYQETNREDPLLLDLVTADILPASIEVSGTDVESLLRIQQDLNELPHIDEVVYQKEVIDQLTKWTGSVRLIGLTGVTILAFTSLLTIIIVTGMKSAARRAAINIMRMIGASKWYIQSPFIYEGLIYGLVGSILGWAGMYITLLYVTPWLKDFLGSISILPIPIELLLAQLLIGSLVGMIFGSLASSIAVRRVMRF